MNRVLENGEKIRMVLTENITLGVDIENDILIAQKLMKNDKYIKCGNIEINLSKYEAKVDDKSIDLTPREFELLYAFCENEGNLMSREQIFDEIWGYSFIGNTKTLDVHIQRIREKIEKDPREPKRLVTVRGVGYKLVTDG